MTTCSLLCSIVCSCSRVCGREEVIGICAFAPTVQVRLPTGSACWYSTVSCAVSLASSGSSRQPKISCFAAWDAPKALSEC